MGIREGLLKGEMRGGGRVLEGLEGGVDGGYGELGWFGWFGSWVLANLACIGLLMEVMICGVISLRRYLIPIPYRLIQRRILLPE